MLVKQENLQNYFHDCLHNSLCKHNIQATDYTIIYLSNLLNNFSRSENFVDASEGRSPYKPLALHYSDAVNSSTEHERDIALRRLGDLSLFICGLFSDSLKTKAVDVDYFIAMGGSAYGHLSESKSVVINDSALNEVFCELSDKFIDFADVLSELNENQGQSNKDVLRIYEIWLRTGSKRAQKILIESGIQPMSGNTSMQKQ